jgi:hypothetical protein
MAFLLAAHPENLGDNPENLGQEIWQPRKSVRLV